MNGNTKKRRGIGALIGILLELLVATPLAQAADSGVLAPDTTHFGKTYGEWSAAWWQWALSIPVHTPPFSSKIHHPLVDRTGAQCDVGQSGKVWFLGGVFSQTGAPAVDTIVRNDCSVPSSKVLFFPLLNVECSVLEGSAFGCANTEAGLRDVVKSIIDQAGTLAADVMELRYRSRRVTGWGLKRNRHSASRSPLMTYLASSGKARSLRERTVLQWTMATT